MICARYILDADHHVVEEPDLMRWALWFENISNRIVDYTEITSAIRVSTVFLGIDHRFDDRGPPLLFETMIFGGDENGQWRYASWDDAVIGHQAAVRMARAAHAKFHSEQTK